MVRAVGSGIISGMSERRVQTNGIELAYETFGDPADPALLLVIGLGLQLIHWDRDFCTTLATKGFQVVIFDNRDSGLSSKVEDGPKANLWAGLLGRYGSASYRLEDMADDTAGLLNALDLGQAHVLGVSLGGMIAQTLALNHPRRVLSLASVMSSTGKRLVGLPRPRALRVLLRAAPPDRASYIEGFVRAQRAIGSPAFGVPEARTRELAAAGYDRAFYPQGTVRQLLAALAVAFVGSSVPAMMGRLIATISAPHYFASAENQWPDYILPHLRSWAVPQDVAQAITNFYQGLPTGAHPAWQVWVVPLFWWTSFVFAIYVACLSIATILRRQWVERERLAFPLATVPLALTQPDPGVTRKGLLRDRLFWLGVSLPLFIILWNMVGYSFPTFPLISFAYGYPQLDITIARDFPKVSAKADFYVFAFAYFTNLNILLSIWFFHLLAVLQIGASNRIGFGPGTFDAGVNSQSFGGLAFFVLWGLWVARSHLRDVVRKAWRNDCSVDDSQELVSYRFACLSTCVCFICSFTAQDIY